MVIFHCYVSSPEGTPNDFPVSWRRKLQLLSAAGPCRPGYSSWSPPPSSRTAGSNATYFQICWFCIQSLWQWLYTGQKITDLEVLGLYRGYKLIIVGLYYITIILYPGYIYIYHFTFEDSSVLVWISHDISSFSPEILRKMPAPGSSSNITVRSGRAPMASRTFLKACSRSGLGMGKTAWKSWVSPQKVEDGSGRYGMLACDCKFNWSNSVKWDRCAE